MNVFVIVEMDAADSWLVGPFDTAEEADEWAGRTRELTEHVNNWHHYPHDGVTPVSPAAAEQRIRGEMEREEQ